jgi:hypothetical protein
MPRSTHLRFSHRSSERSPRMAPRAGEQMLPVEHVFKSRAQECCRFRAQACAGYGLLKGRHEPSLSS